MYAADQALDNMQIQMWLAAGLSASSCPSLKWLISMGEPMPVQVLRTLQKRLPHTALFYGYGPAEAAVYQTVKIFRELGSHVHDGPIIVGKPLLNIHVYVVDSQRQLVPVGVPGELLVSGVCLARGYLNRPDLTEQAFLPNRLIEDAAGYFSRMYCTGQSSL